MALQWETRADDQAYRRRTLQTSSGDRSREIERGNNREHYDGAVPTEGVQRVCACVRACVRGQLLACTTGSTLTEHNFLIIMIIISDHHTHLRGERVSFSTNQLQSLVEVLKHLLKVSHLLINLSEPFFDTTVGPRPNLARMFG